MVCISIAWMLQDNHDSNNLSMRNRTSNAAMNETSKETVSD